MEALSAPCLHGFLGIGIWATLLGWPLFLELSCSCLADGRFGIPARGRPRHVGVLESDPQVFFCPVHPSLRQNTACAMSTGLLIASSCRSVPLPRKFTPSCRKPSVSAAASRTARDMPMLWLQERLALIGVLREASRACTASLLPWANRCNLAPSLRVLILPMVQRGQ